MTADALTRLFQDAAAKGAGRLTEATGSLWKTDAVEASREPVPFSAQFAGTAKDQFGSHFAIPGATFLVVFPAQSGYLVAACFTREHEESFGKVTDVVLKSLAEVANIMLQPLVGHLASAWKTPVIISSPKMQAASQKELLDSALKRFSEQGMVAAAYLLKLSSPDLFSECAVLVLLDASISGLAL